MFAKPAAAETWKAEVVIGISLRNQASYIRRSLSSALEQATLGLKSAILILDDHSSDDWMAAAGELLADPRIVIVKALCGSPARARNALLDFAESSFPSLRWIARLDADDRFSTPESLATAFTLGDQIGAQYVLGGNRLVKNSRLLECQNPATRKLLDPDYVLAQLEAIAQGTAKNELPSCNLLLRAHSGWRYPDISSAEDHWLVADLLLHHADKGAILDQPFFADYTLSGTATSNGKRSGNHQFQRWALLLAARRWHASLGHANVLGYGQEGIVQARNGWVEKHFYEDVLSDERVNWLQHSLPRMEPFLPRCQWKKGERGWIARYPHQETSPATAITLSQAKNFLLACLENEVVCLNIKRTNFRISPEGQLVMVDVGEDIVPMNVDYFRDSAARLFGLAAHGWPDDELLRRPSTRRQEDVLEDIPGLHDFYRDLLCTHGESLWHSGEVAPTPSPLPVAEDVTLLIKVCAMDAGFVTPQVRHIVSHLQVPRPFLERVLLVDTFNGPFLRQHSPGDLDQVLMEANALVATGLIDRILIAPNSSDSIREINHRWFGLDCMSSHSTRGIPVSPQIWGFDQVMSRYVLQCDLDVLIGRRDWSHDFLSDMRVAAMQSSDVLCVAFNIPHGEDSPPIPYDAPDGEYVPEVRCGLLDLHRVRASLPLPNEMEGGALTLSWYRSLQQFQRLRGYRTLRGGDPRTFYIHPMNDKKQNRGQLAVIRDLTGQAYLPEIQANNWDVAGTIEDWHYPRRAEDIVFLLKGRNIPEHRVRRCLASLAMQDDQDFGIILIDDGSDGTFPSLLPHFLGKPKGRTTLIRRERPVGRIPNFIMAIREVCEHPTTLIVILDLDDALMHRGVVRSLRQHRSAGKDVILTAMFRPDKPLKLYHPDFANPRRNWGGDTWIHLRAFRKSLFDAIPDDHLKIEGKWIPECTDYATMIPMVELCHAPTYLPAYYYFHERSTPQTPEIRARKDILIRAILSKPQASF